ncbi:probable G-protein coupled receptor 156 [Boleophthalmus pectinirostris]|uniref:probable G-protein coupled receptor 156 n=1 Tax=Boleophthalmus pectinirostris TaxID=150288 RepID=UPI00242D92D5|nr:probable G-protein coupled receptor 156 [Boleophthalmus pectinirostris]
MEPNCSVHCDSSRCSIPSGLNSAEALLLLQRMCSLSTMAVELPRRTLSPVLSAVVWTMLSCGILLTCAFFFFTMRFKNNRIVKMSSPNLNVLTLFGSVLTYASGFLFAADGQSNGVIIQFRIWTLCLGSTLVFGPILGKTWRLYRVFTQRVPDKRVIIRDIQLMGMVVLLILVDILILMVWNITDPIKCSSSLGAVVKIVEKEVSYSLSRVDSCSSALSHLWVIIIAVQKGCLLLYGTYLAGLTSNVSHPPVNQSPTIITAVTLVTLASTVVIPVYFFLHSWPNLVYSAVAGAIFICTLATNCMLFVPQLTQWRQFEEDQNNPNQMAKYFSSPSKSQASVYSQEEIYYLLGENDSMKKLLNEKNAVIDSLQEQVKNAKEKLLRLMSASQILAPSLDHDMSSSTTNIHSSSTQTTELLPEDPSLLQRNSNSRSSPGDLSPVLTSSVLPSSPALTLPKLSSPVPASSPTSNEPAVSKDISIASPKVVEKEPSVSSGLLRTAEETAKFVTSLQQRRLLNPSLVEALSKQANSKITGFVSSEQLQEILQELSVDTVLETTLRSPGQLSIGQTKCSDTLSPLSVWSQRSAPVPVVFQYPRVSPYSMRKRRPPFHSPRRALSPHCFYTTSDSTCGKSRDACKLKDQEVLCEPQGEVQDVQNSEVEEEAEEHGTVRTGHRSRRCPVRASTKNVCIEGAEEAGEEKSKMLCKRHIRDSSGYWDSDSSSSTDYCYYHRPYCESCLQRGSLTTSDSSSDSDSEYEDYTGLYRSPHPVVFKEDLKPTFV